MNYQGKLYGKIGSKYFDTGITSDDWDELVKDYSELKDSILDFLMDLDRNGVEIPEIMWEDWNNLEHLTDK